MERFKVYMEKIFGQEITLSKIRRNPKVRIKNHTYRANSKFIYNSYICSRKLVEFFTYMGLKDSTSKNNKTSSYFRVIPDCIMRSNREHKLAFLSAYIDGDGSVAISGKNYAVNIFSRSNHILWDLHALLRDLGYASNINLKHHKINMNSYESYLLCNELNLSRKAKRFSKEIPCPYGIPGEIIGNWIKSRYVGSKNNQSTYRDDNGNVITPNGKSYGKLFNHLVYVSHKNNFEYRPPMLYDKDYSEILDFVKKISPLFYANLKLLLERKYKFERIISIRNWKKIPVYDLTMDLSK
jgi:hypothetical protein